MRRFFLITVILLLVSCLLFSAAYLINPKNTRSFFVRNILGIKCLDYKQGVFSKKLNNKIPDYIEYSKRAGIKKCKDEKEIRQLADQGKLVKIESGKYFIVSELSHSYPYLTRNSLDLLNLIGMRFQKKISGTRLKGAKFKITSMTRTTDKLRKLRSVNSNASLNSPHQFANAFDIGYIRFSTRRYFLTNCDEKYLMEALAEVIWQLKKEKRCWATFEVQQNCYHVVSR